MAFQNLDTSEEKSTVSYRFPAIPFFIQSYEVRHSKKNARKLLTSQPPQGGNSGLGPAQCRNQATPRSTWRGENSRRDPPGQLECGMSIAPLPLFYLHGDMGVDSWHTWVNCSWICWMTSGDQGPYSTLENVGHMGRVDHGRSSTFARHRMSPSWPWSLSSHEVFSTPPKWDISPFASITGQTVSWASTLIAPRHANPCGQKLFFGIEAEVWFQRGLEESRDNVQFHWLGYAKTAFGFRMWLPAHTAWEVSGAVNLKMKLKMTQKFREKPAGSLQIYAKKIYNNYFKVPSAGLMWLQLGSESEWHSIWSNCGFSDHWYLDQSDTIWVSDIYQILIFCVNRYNIIIPTFWYNLIQKDRFW